MKAAVELWGGRPQRLVKKISTTPLTRRMESDSHALAARGSFDELAAAPEPRFSSR